MPCVEIFQNKNTNDMLLCSFVLCKELGGGYTPTGPLISIFQDDFRKNAVEIVTKEFELFFTREYGIKSELYDEMPKAEQKRFFSQHSKVMISWPIKDRPVSIYVGPNDDLYGKLDYPFDKATFADYILTALSKDG